MKTIVASISKLEIKEKAVESGEKMKKKILKKIKQIDLLQERIQAGELVPNSDQKEKIDMRIALEMELQNL